MYIIIYSDFVYERCVNNMKKFSKDTLNLTIKLTNNCNLRCVYCYQNHENDILTLDNTEIIIKFLKKQVEAGYKSVDIHWFGGEPLFYFQQLKDYSSSYLNVQKDFLKINMEFPRPTLIDIGCIFNATSSFLIETDLKLFFCTSSEDNPSFEQGRILKDGNIELNYTNYCSRVNSSPFDDDECMECKLLPICMGGCPLKRILGKEPCIPEKYYINDYVKLLYLEAIKNV